MNNLQQQNMVSALEYAKRAMVKPRLEVAQLQLLLHIGSQKDPKNMQELAAALDVDGSFVSRNVKAFGQGGTGPQMLYPTIDYKSPKCRLVHLTAEGSAILYTVVSVLGGSESPSLPPALDKRRKQQTLAMNKRI